MTDIYQRNFLVNFSGEVVLCGVESFFAKEFQNTCEALGRVLFFFLITVCPEYLFGFNGKKHSPSIGATPVGTFNTQGGSHAFFIISKLLVRRF